MNRIDNKNITANVYAEMTRFNAHVEYEVKAEDRGDKKRDSFTSLQDRFSNLSRVDIEKALAQRNRDADGAHGCEHVSLEQYGKLIDDLAKLRADYKEYRKQHPDQQEATNGCRGLGEILDDPNLTTDEMCVQVVEVIIHERPETADEIRASIPSNEIPNAGGQPPPNTEISRGIFSAFGGLANLVGGFLQSPLAVPLLTAACMAIPGLQPLAPFIPAIAPVAGMALGAVGGMAGQVGEGQQPTLDPASLASPDVLASVLPALSGLVGA